MSEYQKRLMIAANKAQLAGYTHLAAALLAMLRRGMK